MPLKGGRVIAGVDPGFRGGGGGGGGGKVIGKGREDASSPLGGGGGVWGSAVGFPIVVWNGAPAPLQLLK